MSAEPDRKPGQFADERFRARRAAWRRRAAPYALAGAALMTLATIGVAVLVRASLTFYAGFALGTAVVLIITLLNAPPHHIEQ